MLILTLPLLTRQDALNDCFYGETSLTVWNAMNICFFDWYYVIMQK